MTTNIQPLIDDAASILRRFSADLANAWVNQPFNRVAIAHAFTAGFTSNDANDTCAVILRTAHLDKQIRAAQ